MRRTLAREVCFEGTGIHSGQPGRVSISPSEPGTGLVFLKDGVRIPATVENVVSSDRRTDLGVDGVAVMTAEHILAVMVGLGVDDALVRIEGQEIPAMDGSALDFARAVSGAGLVETGGEEGVFKLREGFEFRDGASLYVLAPAENLRLSCEIRYDHPFIPRQRIELSVDPASFTRELAPARTYAFYEEVREVLERGLGHGGNPNNVLVIKQDGYMNPARFPDEPVRHKALDFIGDMALLGLRPCFAAECVAPGHRANQALVKHMKTRGVQT